MGRRGLWLLILTVGLRASAGCEKPSPGPDLSSPKSAAVTFTKALEAGDLATARTASNASGFESDLLEAMAESASAMRQLTDIASLRLGDEARRIAEQHASLNMSKMLAEGQVEQTGDRATLRSKDGAGAVQLQKVDHQWRIDVGALTKGKDVSQVVMFLRAAALAARQVADDIDAGRITSISEAHDAMLRRVTANLPRRVRDHLMPRNLSARPATTLPT